ITEAAGDGNILFSVLSSADELLMDMIQKAVASVTAELPVILTAVAAALPQIVLFLGVFLLASVYLTIEYREIGIFLHRTFPNKTSAVLRGLRSSLMSTILLYGRAYTILCLITFVELYIGFRILDIDWAFGASLLGALIDLLPVIGTGTFLLPWAVFELIRGAWYRGIGLVILYIIICVIRQILEPKIVGRNIGLHPLAALFCMYVGMKLFGLAGLFFVPMAAAVVWKYYLNRKTRDGAYV
ncbi:MAG: AI-2E family transporter, partial [Eubacteriales bacterium]